MDTLSKLFGNPAYVKIMRLFLFNPHTAFETKDVKSRAQVSQETARREVAYIHNLGLIKRKNFAKESAKKTKKGIKALKRKAHGWILNGEFSYIEPLRHILLSTKSFHEGSVSNRFKNVGSLKLLIVSGVFVNELERTNTRGRVDILLVGDRLKQRPIHTALKNLESETGKDLQYAVMKTKDFLYRRSVYDKFIRDILDYPHQVLVDKLGI